MVIGEIGSTEHGGSKADWIADVLEPVPTEYPQIRGLLWFDKFDDGDGLADRDLAQPPRPSPPGSRTRPIAANSFGSQAGAAIPPLG